MIKRLAYVILVIGLVESCVTIKQNALYEESFSPNDTVFYLSSEIYSDYITSEGWVTQDKRCIEAKTTKNAAYRGELGIDLKWNRTLDGCPWIGFGFGWDSWTGKDLTKIKNTAALQFHVRMVEGERNTLPWALGFEDFTGASAYLGMSPNAIKAEKITTEWTRVEMPIAEFNWDEQGTDISNIKQLIFDTQADGHVYIDEIKIVPYSGGYRKRANIGRLQTSGFSIDGLQGDAIWNTKGQTFGNGTVYLGIADQYLCIAIEVKDDTPLQNNFSGKDLFKGDAFEIAFTTDPESKTRRTNYRSTDQHLGFGLSEKDIKTWDWTKEREIEGAETATKKTESGYVFEAKIDLDKLNIDLFREGELYGLELAIDYGNYNGRERQERWNDPVNSGFFKNPSLWGELYVMMNEELNN